MSSGLAERFYARVGQQTPDGCIEWVGYCMPHGYGMLGKRLAHRLAYSFEHGPIPEGMVVMHKCDNPKCVNVEHLQLGTQGDNVADMMSKGREKRSKLVPHVPEIRALKASGLSQRKIAKKFGVSPQLITLLFQGKLPTHGACNG